jgi:putative nucleotidyltransferase with HDIG domain
MHDPNSHLAIVRALMAVIDASDPFTRGHSFRISKYVLRMARHLKVPESKWEVIEYAALLHDIGRTAIKHDVLMRPGKLDVRERAMLHAHATIGNEILRSIPGFEEVAEIVYAHHEQPDGMGYPNGLRGDKIPTGSRLIMVAAAYDAMTEDRPYRKGLLPDAALAELERHAGTQFFPEAVAAFTDLHRSGTLFEEFGSEELEIYANPRNLTTRKAA